MSGDAFQFPGAGADLASLLRGRARDLLIGATIAQYQVETSRDEAFTADDPVIISIFTPKISRTWVGDAAPQFLAKVTLAIVGRVLMPTLKQTETLTDTLRVQIENVLLCAPSFWLAPLQRINSIDTTIEFPGSNEKHEGQVTMVMECECVDIFAPIEIAPFEIASLSVPNPTVPAGTAPADNLIGATITIPQGD